MKIDIVKARKAAKDGGFWYLASPYTKYPHGIKKAFEHACQAAAYLEKNGVPVYCPIAYTHSIALHGKLDPCVHDRWLSLDKRFAKHAVGVIVTMMDGWEESFGVNQEIGWFKDSGRPVVYLSWVIGGWQNTGQRSPRGRQ